MAGSCPPVSFAHFLLRQFGGLFLGVVHGDDDQVFEHLDVAGSTSDGSILILLD